MRKKILNALNRRNQEELSAVLNELSVSEFIQFVHENGLERFIDDMYKVLYGRQSAATKRKWED